MRVLVTGGAGFLGSHLVHKLFADGHDVAIIDDMSGGKLGNLPLYHPIEVFDLRDEDETDYFIKQFRPEVVYHLAANAAEQKAQFSPIDITTRNWNTFINVLTPFIKYGGRKFVFTSSIAVYGALQVPFLESYKPEPEDLYGISKLACEQALQVMSKVHDFEYVIARPHNVYGPRQNMTDPYRNVVMIWMNALLSNKPYYIYGDGSMKRCFSYVDDVIDALYLCGMNGVKNNTFNIGADKAYTLKELSDAIQKAADIFIEPIYKKDRAQEVHTAIADHQRAKTLLGYDDRTSLEEGIKRTWEWAKTQGYQYPHKADFEIDSPKIPVNWR